MPGLGKTTLACKLYYDKSIISHFDIRAQCCVSQVYTFRNLLLAILCDAIGEDSKYENKSTNELADELRRTLLPKRYLILVDDVWEASAWDDLRPCFHDAKNGSRIILTTRHFEVANYATSVSKPIPLRMFSDDESWNLLENKLFAEESCPLPFEEVRQEIAKKCGGLPLSVVLMAGILSKMEKKEESWKEVAATLSSHIRSDSKAIVEQKAFIKSCEGKNLEDIAAGYLENLIGRNLVMIAERASLDGKVEACRIHDVLLEFCKIRATEENFLQWIKWDQNANPSSCIYSYKQHAHGRLAFSDKRYLTPFDNFTHISQFQVSESLGFGGHC
ncbi:putative late blight resistance protein homolog R1B-12 [Nicotiana sylvestris]|uniref:putative late blight resistance protein homolog R1B-12 n=1 Tax=Nicotiana sylvestris TaxID=4096 RepID=UPI00388CCB39